MRDMREWLRAGAVALVVLTVLALTAFGGFYDQALTWGAAEADTCQVVQANACTSNVFQLAEGEGRGDRWVNALALYYKTDEVNDSTYVYFALDVSPDGSSYWYNNVLYADTTTTADDVQAVTITLTSVPEFRYARIRAIGKMASGDTVTIQKAYIARVYTE